LIIVAASARADVGDPQVRTDHPWYPGELACSTFARLFATQAELYERVVAEDVQEARARALAILRRRGVHTIDVPAERLTVATIQRYLELKSRYL